MTLSRSFRTDLAPPRSAGAGNNRRRWLGAALLAPWWTQLHADEPVRAALERGGVVIAFRHALAPGTFDPPDFRLADCSTQRNLSDEGRAQARRIGEWFRARTLAPTRVRSSPWCRCLDTAMLAFGRAEHWPALGSPHGRAESESARHQDELRQALAAVPPGRFEAWVTHQFVLQALAGTSTASAEALVLRAGRGAAVELLARASLP
jgi:hypothetical protein